MPRLCSIRLVLLRDQFENGERTRATNLSEDTLDAGIRLSRKGCFIRIGGLGFAVPAVLTRVVQSLE